MNHKIAVICLGLLVVCAIARAHPSDESPEEIAADVADQAQSDVASGVDDAKEAVKDEVSRLKRSAEPEPQYYGGGGHQGRGGYGGGRGHGGGGRHHGGRYRGYNRGGYGGRYRRSIPAHYDEVDNGSFGDYF